MDDWIVYAWSSFESVDESFVICQCLVVGVVNFYYYQQERYKALRKKPGLLVWWALTPSYSLRLNNIQTKLIKAWWFLLVMIVHRMAAVSSCNVMNIKKSIYKFPPFILRWNSTWDILEVNEVLCS